MERLENNMNRRCKLEEPDHNDKNNNLPANDGSLRIGEMIAKEFASECSYSSPFSGSVVSESKMKCNCGLSRGIHYCINWSMISRSNTDRFGRLLSNLKIPKARAV
jgi:hypothetical protein